MMGGAYRSSFLDNIDVRTYYDENAYYAAGIVLLFRACRDIIRCSLLNEV